MEPNVLLIKRKGSNQVIAIYAGVISHKHIYGRLLLVNKSTWPTYMKVRKSLTKAILDENDKGTGVRNWFVDDDSLPELPKSKLKELKAFNEEDEDFINIVNQILEDKEFCQKYKTFLKDSH